MKKDRFRGRDKERDRETSKGKSKFKNKEKKEVENNGELTGKGSPKLESQIDDVPIERSDIRPGVTPIPQLSDADALPSHPIFQRLIADNGLREPDFLECLDALDRIRHVVAVSRCVSNGAASSEDTSTEVLAGQQWLSLMVEDSLGYVGRRLKALNGASVKEPACHYHLDRLPVPTGLFQSAIPYLPQKVVISQRWTTY